MVPQITNNFNGEEIRYAIINNEKWFSISDIIAALTGTTRPRKYWNDLKKKIILEEYSELSEKIGRLKMASKDGKEYRIDCATMETVLRIIQSIPSPKAEPFKQWMAKVAKERIEEVNNPELAISRGQERARKFYAKKGMDPVWISDRIKGISERNLLTEEWKERGVTNEYGLLTSIGHKGAFGITPKEHKSLKKLKVKDKLRDNMINLELAWVRVSEEIQRSMIKAANPKGPKEVEEITKRAAYSLSESRKKLEEGIQKNIASQETPFVSIEGKVNLYL